MHSITGVVKNLLLINIVLFVASITLLPALKYLLAVYYPTSAYFKPYQVLTHMFMHANVGHIVFNMLGLYMFGTQLEYVMGAKRFLTFYLVSGLGALALYMLFKYVELHYMGGDVAAIDVPMLGASGAIYGLLAGFAYHFPNVEMMSLFIPVPVKAKYAVLIYAGIELFLGVGRFSTGVAHFAHLGGALFGFLLLLYWGADSRRR